MGDLRVRTARRLDAEVGISLRKRRAWFDGDGESNGGGSGGNTDTQPDKTGGSNANQNAGANADAKFTQADLDRIAGETRKTAKQAAINDLLKELGFEKADELKALVTDAKTRAENEKTETQKLTDAKAALETKLKERETELESVKAAQRLKDRDSAIKDALRAAGVTDSEKAPNVSRVLVLLQAERTAEVEALLETMGEDGTVNADRLKKLVEVAKAEYADYFQQRRGFNTPGSPSTNGGRAPSQAERDDKVFGSKPLVRL